MQSSIEKMIKKIKSKTGFRFSNRKPVFRISINIPIHNKRLQNQAGLSSDSKFKYQQQLMNSSCLRGLQFFNRYKLSDDGVSRLRLVVTVRQRKVRWCADCRRTLP